MRTFDLGLRLFPIQKTFMSCPAHEICFGGSVGGSKTFSGTMKAFMLGMSTPGIHIGVFRKTLPELRMTLLAEARKRYPKALHKYRESNREIILPNGSRITFNYVETEADLLNYKGVEFDVIIVDESVDLTESKIVYLKSRLRSSNPNFETRFYLLTNPGGVSHAYHKRRYMDGKEPFKLYKTPETEMIPNEGAWVNGVFVKPRYMCYIPSKLTDNPALLKNDPTYLFSLRELPEKEFLSLLLGLWDVLSGLFFSEWNEKKHAIESYAPSHNDMLYIAGDWGTAKPASFGFYAMRPNETLVRFDEIYTMKTNQPNQGTRENAVEVAEKVKEKAMIIHELTGNKFTYLVLDSQCWVKEGFGYSIADIFQEVLYPLGITVIQAKKDRVSGWQTCRKFLRENSNHLVPGTPYFQVTKNCKNFIRTVPDLMYDPDKDGDIDTEMEDHAADEWRYMLMSIPQPRSMKLAALPPEGSMAYHEQMVKMLARVKRSGSMT